MLSRQISTHASWAHNVNTRGLDTEQKSAAQARPKGGNAAAPRQNLALTFFHEGNDAEGTYFSHEAGGAPVSLLSLGGVDDQMVVRGDVASKRRFLKACYLGLVYTVYCVACARCWWKG